MAIASTVLLCTFDIWSGHNHTRRLCPVFKQERKGTHPTRISASSLRNRAHPSPPSPPQPPDHCCLKYAASFNLRRHQYRRHHHLPLQSRPTSHHLAALSHACLHTHIVTTISSSNTPSSCLSLCFLLVFHSLSLSLLHFAFPAKCFPSEAVSLRFLSLPCCSVALCHCG